MWLRLLNDYAKDSLNLYRVIDPQIWVRLVGRVNGANFTAIYGRSKAMGYRNITLPEGHTWESYTRFLLATLPARLRENYVRKFKTSIQFWHNVGGGLGEEAIRELKEHGYKIRRNGVSNYTIMRNSRVVFLGKNTRPYGRHQIYQRHSKLETDVLLHIEKRSCLPLYGL